LASENTNSKRPEFVDSAIKIIVEHDFIHLCT